jgi:iron complex transport system ATP-binding protein
MSKLINVSQLNWQIENKYILNNISFEVCKGEIIGVIGPNGAGKTSLLRCLTNQNNILNDKNLRGSVYLNKRNLISYSSKQIAKHFAVVMQKNEMIFALSVNDVMKMGLLPHKSLFAFDTDHDKAQIILALGKVGLKHAINHKFSELSGGEQQRVLIARSIVQSSQVLILDEPTTHLDVYYQHQVLQLVKQLNLTVIMTVHDLNLASLYCQRLLLLDHGKLLADGTPTEVLTPSQLQEVFSLPCQQNIDPVNGATQVTFYLPEQEPFCKQTVVVAHD